MRISRFKIGFLAGYVVATLRHSKDADPLIQRLKQMEGAVQGVRDWWYDVDDEHPVRRLLTQGRYAA